MGSRSRSMESRCANMGSKIVMIMGSRSIMSMGSRSIMSVVEQVLAKLACG